MIGEAPGTTSEHSGSEPEAIDVQAVARLYSVSARHAIRMADIGEIPAGFKLGHLRRWSRRAILADIASKQQAASR